MGRQTRYKKQILDVSGPKVIQKIMRVSHNQKSHEIPQFWNPRIEILPVESAQSRELKNSDFQKTRNESFSVPLSDSKELETPKFQESAQNIKLEIPEFQEPRNKSFPVPLSQNRELKTPRFQESAQNRKLETSEFQKPRI